MAIFSKVAVALDSCDFPRFEGMLRNIGKTCQGDHDKDFDNVVEITTPDNTYVCVYWDYILWHGTYVDDFLKMMEQTRHAIVTISEDGTIFEDIETQDENGCDEEFRELLSWSANICFWGFDGVLSHEREFLPISRERLTDILKTYVSNDAEASADYAYVYESLCQAGCDVSEIKALGFEYVIPEEDLTEAENDPFQIRIV